MKKLLALLAVTSILTSSGLTYVIHENVTRKSNRVDERKTFEQELKDLSVELDNYKKNLYSTDKKFKNLTAEDILNNGTIRDLNKELAYINKQIEANNQEIAAKDEQIKKLTQEISDSKKAIEQINKDLPNNKKKANQLELEKNNEKLN
ncbi:coiled-coil domain-containing protein [Mycoplasma mycoides]|uniref:hypothetical protein n=1 Tax=Mycoplasma mycoides TaxID=2102 RepID=UPI0022408FCF|nr:hypothetical protein [Mycoplasma mycoides]